MIPDHLIDKAAMAAYDDHYWSDELYLLWGELGDRIQDGYRALARAALEAVAADIWQDAYDSGVHDEFTSQDWTRGNAQPNRKNPYKASEDA